MSQKTEIRLNKLEERLSKLARRVTELEEERYEAQPAERGWKAVHRGHGRWAVVGPTGTSLGTEMLDKEAALRMASEMNSSLEGAEVA